ncbi:hypothetical protein KKP04_02740 [Rhodomicrobium sp. Az07]|uniref:hypothetical protein n=1 Tax=Rhodomicrobium sp. Az07 TaxID=2839034 RepID=UPI001BE63A0E|nr:hypothetical protein [Rhodomicrobium sp. Az07]MBT3069784.1 hypothetical protein [Rhodomicrobium sp. Az07]
MTSPPNFDHSSWPIARYRMPDRVPDDLAQESIAEFDALLARNERFVLIMHGPDMPQNSKLFLRLYREWFKRNRAAQQRLCAGAVRVEPDDRRRASLTVKAISLLNKAFLPYPYRVVANNSAAVTQAQAWLTE